MVRFYVCLCAVKRNKKNRKAERTFSDWFFGFFFECYLSARALIFRASVEEFSMSISWMHRKWIFVFENRNGLNIRKTSMEIFG